MALSEGEGAAQARFFTVGDEEDDVVLGLTTGERTGEFEDDRRARAVVGDARACGDAVIVRGGENGLAPARAFVDGDDVLDLRAAGIAVGRRTLECRLDFGGIAVAL